MAEKVIALRADMVAIADAIRAKLGSEDAMTIKEMDEKIGEISTGGINTSDATATAEDIANGKTAYVNGEKITGTLVPSKSSKTVYLDWSGDEEWTEEVSYIHNGEFFTVYHGEAEIIEADGGIVFCNYGASYGTEGLNCIYDTNNWFRIFCTQSDGATLYLVTTGEVDN